MFGYVTANHGELSKEQQRRYGAVYCGICRQIRDQSGNIARLGLSYDMAFLALLLMSLYEPEERTGKDRCLLHPVKARPWVENPFVSYSADMNVALAYYNFLDDWTDEGSQTARLLAKSYEGFLPQIEDRYPRQCSAIQACIRELSRLEKENCGNPDEAAAVFGALMAQLLIYREDLWTADLGVLGDSLGRFIYLLDAMLDYDKDKRKGRYNPFLTMDTGKDWNRWEEYLVLTMARATQAYERLPLVQDKQILDNILYSGIWVSYHGKRKQEGSHGKRSV